jgi:YHS domain-containing protein
MKLLLSLVLLSFGFTYSAFAADRISTPALSGYDPVSYFTSNTATRGSGFHTAEHAGKTYLFASKANKNAFVKKPTNYLPQFGGWCAFGLSVGKKFYSDPTVFAVVDGKLYLNLDKKIQKDWNKDRTGNIKKAHSNWKKFAESKVSEL